MESNWFFDLKFSSDIFCDGTKLYGFSEHRTRTAIEMADGSTEKGGRFIARKFILLKWSKIFSEFVAAMRANERPWENGWLDSSTVSSLKCQSYWHHYMRISTQIVSVPTRSHTHCYFVWVLLFQWSTNLGRKFQIGCSTLNTLLSWPRLWQQYRVLKNYSRQQSRSSRNRS